MPPPYRGRIAPSPTGLLHAGHAATFLVARHRADSHGGILVLRNDDLDHSRCKPTFTEAALEDLRWLGLLWEEGPDVGGGFGPYTQSQRLPLYIEAMERLASTGWVYPCTCSRRDIAAALAAPHAGEEEPLYPGFCRPPEPRLAATFRSGVNWRFRIPRTENLLFEDTLQGPQTAVAGVDFGDFLVWRKDGVPSYQLACTVDDALMEITEVVRGADLITSTFRQMLLFHALGRSVPAFHHCPLLVDASGKRLAKRDNALALRTLREAGSTPKAVLQLIQQHNKSRMPGSA